MGAAVDCETIGSGILGQPVNSLTSLALVVAGAIVVSRAGDLWIGSTLAGTGVGSFLFHGPLAPGGEWIHDATLAWLIIAVTVRAAGWTAPSMLAGMTSSGLLFLLLPAAADPVTGALALAAVISVIRTGPARIAIPPLLLLAASAILGRLGATGHPLCDPDSILQTHGLWHIGAASAVAWWVLASQRDETPVART